MLDKLGSTDQSLFLSPCSIPTAAMNNITGIGPSSVKCLPASRLVKTGLNLSLSSLSLVLWLWP